VAAVIGLTLTVPALYAMTGGKSPAKTLKTPCGRENRLLRGSLVRDAGSLPQSDGGI